MRALCLTADGPRTLDVRARIPDGADAVVVAVELAGICRTDLAVARGALPARVPVILGHELAGVVVSGALPAGTHVTALPAVGCGRCLECAARGPLACAERARLGIERDGAFAERIVLPARALVPYPADLGPERGAMIEPVAAALAPVERPLAGRGVVLGQGRIATLTARAVSAARPELDLRLADPERAAARAFDFAIETTGTEAGIAAGVRALRPGGRLVLKCRPPAPLAVPVAALVELGIELLPAGHAPFSAAIELLASGRLALDDLLGPSYALAAHAEAFAAADALDRKVFFRIG